MSSLLLRSTFLAVATLGAFVATAAAQPRPPRPTATLPAVGDSLGVTGSATWGKRDWLYDAPSAKDAAGKVVLHWFCAPKVKTCVDDLARVVTLKENARVYIVAYISSNARTAKKLDPIRLSEGVGRGTLGYGKGVTKMMKEMAISGPASIVVDVDGKVAMVTTNALPADLDARDAKVTALSAAIKDFTSTVSPTPENVAPGTAFKLGVSIRLAPWMSYRTGATNEFKLTAPPDFKCDARSLKGDQLKIDGPTLTAEVTCTAPKGSYEARGELRFGYEDPNKGAGLGNDGGRWAFVIK